MAGSRKNVTASAKVSQGKPNEKSVEKGKKGKEGRRESLSRYAIFMSSSSEVDRSRARLVERKSTCARRRSRSCVMACEHPRRPLRLSKLRPPPRVRKYEPYEVWTEAKADVEISLDSKLANILILLHEYSISLSLVLRVVA